MYVATVPNRRSPPAILLRESYREGTRVNSRTLANITSWPPGKIEALRCLLRGERIPGTGWKTSLEDAFEIVRTRPHGHVAAVLGTLRQLGLEKLIARAQSRERDCVVAMICSRVLDPRSKLATARSLDASTLQSTLGELLGLEWSDEDDLYQAMDWLLPRQPQIEDVLGKRHVSQGTLALYDLTSTYFEGRRCPLARLGHSRDGKKGKLQIVFGLLCDQEGRPVAVEVFEGNTGDPMTVASQVKKVRERFGLERLVLIGDRGMITSARIREDLRPVPGIDWITALRAPTIARLARFSGRAAGGLQEPALGRGAQAQARGAAGSDGAQAGEDRRRRQQGKASPSWPDRHCASGGQGARPLQNAEALHCPDWQGQLAL